MNKNTTISITSLLIGIFIFIGLIVLIFFGCTVYSYNNIVNAHQNAEQKMGDIQSTIQRRADLIPALVRTVDKYAQHEKETLEQVQQLRSEAYQTKLTLPDAQVDVKSLQESQEKIDLAINKLLAITENYPNLQSSENFLTLQSQIEGSENRINVARHYYNEAVANYNSRILSFFGAMTNNTFLHYQPMQYYKATNLKYNPNEI